MIKNDENIIIENEDDLKNPFMCYCIMMRFMNEAGEDYVDYNEDIIKPVPFIMWLNGRNYISNEQVDELISIDDLYLQEVICGGDVLFPNTYGQGTFSEYKCYQMLAEYISCSKVLRKKLYDSVNNKALGFANGEFYKDKNGISLACIIPSEELMVGIHDLHYKNQRDTFDWTFAEMYSFVKDLSIKDCDFEIDY